MKRINFALGIHNHQPVGNLPRIFEEAYSKAYEPFVGVLERHPAVKVTLHYSGCLIDWLLAEHPDFLKRIRRLTEKGQVEMMTGGYYEPILAVIPDRDKIGQIKKLTAFLKENVGCDVHGMWLAERVWEPHLAKPIAETGVKYTVLDDAIFMAAGLREEDLHGYYILEEQGWTINAFPISKKMRYLIPFQSPEKTIKHLQSIAKENGNPVAVFADDGEKFGVWPGTYELVYEKKWLEEFFTALERNRAWITTLTFSEYMTRYRPVGRIYLPTASYSEMMEWSLPTKSILKYEKILREVKRAGKLPDYEPFLKRGFWRNFLIKYPESNNMHKKMLYVSNKVAKLREGEEKEKAKVELWKGQDNDAYWHGIFGGIYLNHLRFMTYRHLITAENTADKNLHEEDTWGDVEVVDFDKDGSNEVLVNTASMNVYFDPANGGTIFELDYKPKHVNLLDTLARRPEAYHQVIQRYSKERAAIRRPEKAKSIHETAVTGKGFEKYLKFDWYRRASLIDHFLGPQTTLSTFRDCTYVEEGDFIDRPYEYQPLSSANEAAIQLGRKGSIMTAGRRLPVMVSKTVTVKSERAEMTVSYEVQNLTEQEIETWFGVEFNISHLVSFDTGRGRHYYIPGETLKNKELTSVEEDRSVRAVGIKDEWLGVEFSLLLSRPALVWRFPIETVSRSEKGFEKISQSSVMLPSWKIHVNGGEAWRVEFKQNLRNL